MSNLGALDMALDDVISQNRSANKRGGNNNNNSRRTGNNSTRGGGINKNRPSGGRSSPYGGRPSRTNSNTSRNSRPTDNASNNPRVSNSLVVANLHFNVTEKDLYDLFGQIGQLKRAFLHIGPNGKSAGIADVVFRSGLDAEKARNTYNNVELDGRPMRITSASIISAVQPLNNNINNGRRGNLRGGNNNNRDNNNNRRDNNNSRGGRGGRRENRPKPNEQDLDAEMDSYMGANNEDTQMN